VWPCGEGGGGTRGGLVAMVDSVGRPARAPGRRAWVVALPREQGRGRARAMRGPERVGDPMSAAGCVREQEERPGSDGAPTRGPGGTVPSGGNSNRISNKI
jgi:hypothetical protein